MISFVLFLVEVLAIPFQKAQVELYHPPTTVSYTKKLQKRSLGTKKMTTAEDAINYLSKEFDIDSKAINITKQYTDQQGILHVYGDRLLNGIAVDNQNFGIHLKDGEILSVSSSFVKDAVLSQVSKRDTELKIEKIISIAEKQYDCPRSNYPVKKIYIQTSDSTIVSAYQFHLRDLDDSKWYQVTSDAKTGDIVQLVDYIHSASYNAVNVHKPNVQAGLEMIENPEYLPSSPLGWHNDGFNVSPFTRGNNCDSLFSVSSKRTFSTRPNVFESTFDSTGDPFLTQNLDAAIINTFYGILFFMVAINVYHDITYQFGFTEEAGNFQTNNFGKGGLENDAIIIRNNDPLKRNNAYFAAPEDGINGVLGLHVFDTAHPFRMASFDNTILAHEFFHGVTTRLTGGSQKSNCLNTREGRALEEGWSDFFCILMQTSPTSTRDTNYFAGSYAYNYLTGFRNFPFSVNMQKNPLKYSDIKNRLKDEHKGGEVWAAMLYEMYWNLVDAYGYSSNWYDSSQTHGNIVALNLVMNALKIQPCDPTFLTARDAIISLAGKDTCLVWHAFAKRGLGIKASKRFGIFRNDFHVPTKCLSLPSSLLVFPPSGSPIQNKLRPNFIVMYPLERIVSCSRFLFCYHQMLHKTKCIEGTIRENNVDFHVTLQKARYFIFIKSESDDGKCLYKDSNWNQMGYTIDIE